MRCPRCGYEIPDNAQFCNYCGTRFEKKKSSTGWIIGLIVGVLVLVIAVAGAFLAARSHNQARQVKSDLESSIDVLLSDDNDEFYVYSLYNHDLDAYGDDEIGRTINRHTTYEVGKIRVNGDRANAEVVFTVPDIDSFLDNNEAADSNDIINYIDNDSDWADKEDEFDLVIREDHWNIDSTDDIIPYDPNNSNDTDIIENIDYNYDAVEAEILEYAPGYIAGAMQFRYYDGKIFYSTREYDVNEVKYFDIDGEPVSFVQDNDGLQSYVSVGSGGIYYPCYPEGSTPYDSSTYDSFEYHIVDFKTGEIHKIPVNARAQFIYYQDYYNGYAYKMDMELIHRYNINTDESELVKICEDGTDNYYNLCVIDGVPYSGYGEAKYTDDGYTHYSNAKFINLATDEVIVDFGNTDYYPFNFYWDDTYLYFSQKNGNEFVVYRTPLNGEHTREEVFVCDVSGSPHIYFKLGDRIYYSVFDYENAGEPMHYYYYDTKTNENVCFGASDCPLGGW